MLKFLFAVIPIVFIILMIPASYAEVDLANQQVIGQSSSEDQIILEFTDNTIRFLMSSTIVAPNLDFAYIESNSGIFLLENADVQVLEDSFRIISHDPPALLYARSLGNNNYQINFYAVENGLFEKTMFQATIDDISERASLEIESQATIAEQKNLVVDSSVPVYGQYNENFVITVKVWDADINPNPLLFSKTDGLLEDVSVKAVLVDPDGNDLVALEGVTDRAGTYQGQYRWQLNDPRGEYTIELKVNDEDYDDLTTFYNGYVAPDSTPTPPPPPSPGP